jgi:transcriptional regulator with GAF, ATPase, and Fis domain
MSQVRLSTTSEDALTEAVVERADDVATVLTELAALLEEDDIGQALDLVVGLAARTVPDCDAAGVTLLDADGKPRTAACTDEKTLEVDQAQYADDDGPCLEAARTATIQRVVVEEAEERWPAFTRSAEQIGIKSFLAAPLVLAGRSGGALNLYSSSAHGFGALDEAFVALFTGQVSAAVLSIQRYGECRRLADNLKIALDSRAVIEQAKGVLMVNRGLGDEEAFEWLREQSQQRNVKLRRIAEELVRGALDGSLGRPE